MMKLRIYIWLFALLAALQVKAQQFEISSFQELETDLTARVNPVFDLNGDATALIKMTCSTDFVFTGPLGIVKRENKTAEVWLYLPQGTRYLTIAHPEWGILRNYTFREPLEGKKTYELIIQSPVTAIPQQITQTNDTVPIAIQPEDKPVTEVPTPVGLSTKSAPRWAVMPSIGIGKNTSAGAAIAYLGKVGGYARFLSNFKSYEKELECDKSGSIGSATPFYNGKVYQSHLTVTVGPTFQLHKLLHLYAGIGYGYYKVFWETTTGENVYNKGLSANGFTADAGFILQHKRLAATAGIQTIQFNNIELTLGIGYIF